MVLRNKKWLVFVVSLVIVYGIAFIGNLFTSSAVQSSWYQQIRPSITPPNYVFPIVWNILFFLIGLSLAFSWINSKNKKQRKIVAFAFGFNLFLNVLWSVLYFGLKNPTWAFVDIILILFSIIWMILVVRKINKKATWMLVPYLLWVSFASILNFLSI